MKIVKSNALRRFFQRKRFTAITWTLGSFVLVIFCLAQFEFTHEKRAKMVLPLTPAFYKFISFGHWPALVDYFWIRTLEKVGAADYSPEVLEEVSEFYRLGVELDPYFYELYDQAAVNFAFFFESPEKALDIIDRGISVYWTKNPPEKFWTHPYSLYLHRGYVNAFLKNDWSSARVDYLKAADMKGSPPYLQSMKLWLQKEGGDKILGRRVLKILVQNTQDPVQRAGYERKLKDLEQK